MNQELTTSFKKVVKGTGVVFIGTILGTLLGFVFRVIVVRYISKAEYGLLSLSLAMINILSMVSCLGFINGVPRFISYALGKKEYGKVWATIKTSIYLVAAFSIGFALILFFFSSHIADFFHEPDLASVIKIITFLLPLIALTELLISILRGLEDVKAKVYFQDIFSMGIKIFIISVVILLGFSFNGVICTYLISNFLTLFFLVYYTKNRLFGSIPRKLNSNFSILKELLCFSLPLLGSSIFNLLRQRLTILFLGYFKTADVVGLYNAALPLAQLISMPLTAITFIYLPIASQLYAQHNIQDMKTLYTTVTKWTFCITLPIFLCMFLAPKLIIRVLFGVKYIEASTALQILLFGFFIHTLLGPNGMTLVSLGKTKIMLFCSAIGTFTGIIAAILLIPHYGLNGAATSSFTSLIIMNFSSSLFLFKTSTVHPFSNDYIKPISITFVLYFITFCFVKVLSISVWWQIFVIIFFLAISFPITLFLTKSFTKQDTWIIKIIERKLISK